MNTPKLSGNRCQCDACGEYFNGIQPFDRHRVGRHAFDRRCLAVSEMEAAGYTRNAAGFWCQRATKPNARPRATAFPPRRAAMPMLTHGGDHARA